MAWTPYMGLSNPPSIHFWNEPFWSPSREPGKGQCAGVQRRTSQGPRDLGSGMAFLPALQGECSGLSCT